MDVPVAGMAPQGPQGGDVLGTIGAVGGAISPFVDIGTKIWNSITGNDLAEKNFKLQQGAFDYQKAMQQQSWAREDNAVQRRVADLKAAGLSPVLAAGSGASSSSPISINPPKRDFVPLDVNFTGMMGQVAQIAQTQAQAKLTAIEAEKKAFALDYFKKKGIPEEGMDIWGKRIAEMLEVMANNNPITKIKDWLDNDIDRRTNNPIQKHITPVSDRMKRTSDLEN